MARMIKSMPTILMAIMLVAWVVPRGEATIGCITVAQYIAPCISYLTNGGLLGDCCSGVKGLYDIADTKPDRQNVCGCLKSLAGLYKVDFNKASGLPGQCGVNVPYKISPDIDCSTVN